MALMMDTAESVTIPQGDVQKISIAGSDVWYKQDKITFDLMPYVQDNVGWWNPAWTACNGYGLDTNWSWGNAWFPVAEGAKLSFKLYLHSSVGHLTAWDENGTSLGYINGSNTSSMQPREWELPTGTKWVRICVAYPKGAIGTGRDQYLNYVGKTPMPRRYQAMDSIVSTGTQYIDTGLTPDSLDIIDMLMTPTDPTGDSKFFGMYGGGIAGSFLGCYNGAWRIGTGLKNSSIAITGNKIRVQNQGDRWYFGNQLDAELWDSCTAIATGAQTYLLFASRFGGSGQPPIQYGKMKCHYLRIAERQNTNYALVQSKPKRMMLPCRDRATGDYGMYDFVTQTFFGNLGSGSFTGA